MLNWLKKIVPSPSIYMTNCSTVSLLYYGFVLNARPENSILERTLVYVASKKPGGRTLSRCAPEDAWKMAFIPLWIIMSWTSPTTLQTKIFLFPFFAHLIFIRKNEVITHLFPLENLESSPFAWYSTNYDGFFANM